VRIAASTIQIVIWQIESNRMPLVHSGGGNQRSAKSFEPRKGSAIVISKRTTQPDSRHERLK
jgi:hypothetical protein